MGMLCVSWEWGDGFSISLIPRPHLKNRERNFLVCAKSAYYVTITCLTWSCGSQLLLTMALQSRWDHAAEKLQTNPVRQEYSSLASVPTLYVSEIRGLWKVCLLCSHFQILRMSLLLSHVKNLVIGSGRTWFLYSIRRLLTQQIREFLQVGQGPFPIFGWGLGTRLVYFCTDENTKLLLYKALRKQMFYWETFGC